MNSDIIKQNEDINIGKYIHLYFNEEIGMYTAYGLSAYLVTYVVDPILSYSIAVQMPVALLKREHAEICRRSLKKLKHEMHRYYLFELTNSLPKDENYERWELSLKSKL
jgi:hypothetical protein